MNFDASREAAVKTIYSTAMAMQIFASGFYFSESKYTFVISDGRTWFIPVMVNLCPCGFLIVEFIFDALVFDIM